MIIGRLPACNNWAGDGSGAPAKPSVTETPCASGTRGSSGVEDALSPPAGDISSASLGTCDVHRAESLPCTWHLRSCVGAVRVLTHRTIG